MSQPLTITFPNAQTATLAYAQSAESLLTTLEQAGIPRHHPTLVLVGGASQSSEADLERVRSLFSEALVPLAEKWQMVVVDGGTDAGIMRLMGQARAEIGGTFALVGVCPRGLVSFPGVEALAGAVPLEQNHSHFVLVPGDWWGAESQVLAQVATAIADGLPSMVVLINGGEITWEDAARNVEEGRILVVVDGTGRTADRLAAAMRGDVVDERAERLLQTGLVKIVPLADGSGALACIIEELLTVGA
jgi:SLOG in TRPM, prokaryote